MGPIKAIFQRIALSIDAVAAASPVALFVVFAWGSTSPSMLASRLMHRDMSWIILAVPAAYAFVRWLLTGQAMRWRKASTVPFAVVALVVVTLVAWYDITYEYSRFGEIIEDAPKESRVIPDLFPEEDIKPWEQDYSN